MQICPDAASGEQKCSHGSLSRPLHPRIHVLTRHAPDGGVRPPGPASGQLCVAAPLRTLVTHVEAEHRHQEGSRPGPPAPGPGVVFAGGREGLPWVIQGVLQGPWMPGTTPPECDNPSIPGRAKSHQKCWARPEYQKCFLSWAPPFSDSRRLDTVLMEQLWGPSSSHPHATGGLQGGATQEQGSRGPRCSSIPAAVSFKSRRIPPRQPSSPLSHQFSKDHTESK